jgi:sodium-dependent dicarboxylate transporter 2/3/5
VDGNGTDDRDRRDAGAGPDGPDGPREGRSGGPPSSGREGDAGGTGPRRTSAATAVPDEELADVPEEGEVAEPTRVTTRAWIGRVLGPVAAVAVYLLLPEAEGLTEAGRGTAAVGVLMAVWWLSEALPLPATALLPIVLFPPLQVVDVGEATAPYADDIIFLFLGGFLLALAMQRWGLHRRVALVTIMAVGTQPVRVVGGFMLATAFLSMWVSNTATAVMMLPIGLSVLQLVYDGSDGDPVTGEDAPTFAICLMLGIAYAASIGSLATIIGTPPNLFLAGYVEETFDITLGFGRWMLLGVPLSATFLVIAWIVLTRIVYPVTMTELPGGRELFRSQLDDLGPVSRGEKIVLVVFVTTALAWVLREPLDGAFGEDVAVIGSLSDTGIGIAAAVVLFLVPVDWRHGVFTLDWATARKLPWGVLLLFGGGLSLAAAVGDSGLDAYIGEQVAGLGGLPLVLLVGGVVVAILLLTELTSNTATAATFLPILGGVAVGLDIAPLALVIPAALAASCAFMMPVATPPNAIVFGSGHLTLPQMVRAGIWLNTIGVVLVVGLTLTVGRAVFGF